MMNKAINTVAKGNAFESRVFDIIQNLIKNEELPVNCKQSKVYCKKKYKSKDTSQDIEIDISIETTMPNSNETALLTLIECKDYSSSISVTKMRDFVKRMEELGAHKGYFFTTSSFQSGARELAKTYHVGMAVVNDIDRLNWVARRIISTRDNQRIDSTVINVISGNFLYDDFPFAAEGNACYTNLFDFLHKDMDLPVRQSFTINYLTEEDILTIIYNKLGLSELTHYAISDSDLLDYITQQGFSIVYTQLPLDVLGEVHFDQKKIFINDEITEGSPRWRFTIAHELGHIILHSDAINKSKISSIEDSINDEDDEVNISDETIKRMEIQANSFASQLLIPEKQLQFEYYKLFKEKGIRNFPTLNIDSQPCNLELLHWFLNKLSLRFNVSKTAIEIKLIKLGFLNKYSSSSPSLPYCL